MKAGLRIRRTARGGTYTREMERGASTRVDSDEPVDGRAGCAEAKSRATGVPSRDLLRYQRGSPPPAVVVVRSLYCRSIGDPTSGDRGPAIATPASRLAPAPQLAREKLPGCMRGMWADWSVAGFSSIGSTTTAAGPRTSGVGSAADARTTARREPTGRCRKSACTLGLTPGASGDLDWDTGGRGSTDTMVEVGRRAQLRAERTT
jgi:hypothetical protein